MNDQPTAPTSPMVWAFPDYLGRAITITATFNDGTGRMTNVVVQRDQGCLYANLLWGLGADGTPDSSTRSRRVPFGSTTVSRTQLVNIGLGNIADLLAVQFTVGR